MTTTAAAPADDHEKRLEKLKSAAPKPTTATVPPVPAAPPPDLRLVVEKTVDIATAMQAALIQNQRLFEEHRAQLAAFYRDLPEACVERQRQNLQLLNAGQTTHAAALDALHRGQQVGFSDLAAWVKLTLGVLVLFAGVLLGTLAGKFWPDAL